MNHNYKELKKNTLIIAIANMGSKIISFILAPLYSYFMSVSQYGKMDLIYSTIGLVLPFVCLDVYEATFRYANDNKYEKRKVLSSSLVTSLPGLGICLLMSFFLKLPEVSRKYMLVICICAVLGAINCVLAQFLRGSNKMISFALSGVVSSIALLLSNVVFLIILKKSLDGWLISFFISKVVETIYLCIACNIGKNFSVHDIDRVYIAEFVKFCIPLLPTATMWWIMNLSDRYMLAFFIGAEATGIYSVSNKLPSLLSIFENIFYQAWQTTAINTVENEDRDTIYSNVFNKYLTVMIVGVLGVLIISKPMVRILFEKNYFSAWIYIPVLMLCVVVHALNGNLGSLYTVFKSTKGALYSTLLGAATNVILNIFLIPIIGIMGASLTTLIGFGVTFLYRWFDTKKFVHIKLDIREIVMYIVLLMIQLLFYYIPGILSYLIRIIMFLILLIYKRDIFLKLIKK